MMLMIPKTEIKFAAAELAAAAANGYTHCDAVFVAGAVEKDDSGNLFLRLSGLIKKAHPTDGNLNWGFTYVKGRPFDWAPDYRTTHVVDGKVVDGPAKSAKKATAAAVATAQVASPGEEAVDYDAAGTEAMIAINKRIAQACWAAGMRKVRVCYSAYKSDDNDVPIDNLDEIAVTGKVVLVSGPNEYYGGPKSKAYRSGVIENPTWLMVAVEANAMIREVRDTHHCFLEGLEHEGTEGDVNVFSFSMGS